MLIKFKKLGINSTFEDFRNAYFKTFGCDYFECTDPEDVPTGFIKFSNFEFIRIENDIVVVFVDDCDLKNDIIIA